MRAVSPTVREIARRISHGASGVPTSIAPSCYAHSIQAARVRREDNVDSGEIVIVLTTVGADVNAGAMATSLVEEHLAACVNVLPEMTSYFRWRGVVEQAEERQLLIKTTSSQLAALEQRLHEIHPYEVPEFLVVPIDAATDAYFKWVLGAVGAATEDGEIKH